jgi:hypothetical protein
MMWEAILQFQQFRGAAAMPCHAGLRPAGTGG